MNTTSTDNRGLKPERTPFGAIVAAVLIVLYGLLAIHNGAMFATSNGWRRFPLDVGHAMLGFIVAGGLLAHKNWAWHAALWGGLFYASIAAVYGGTIRYLQLQHRVTGGNDDIFVNVLQIVLLTIMFFYLLKPTTRDSFRRAHERTKKERPIESSPLPEI